ncbi:hypothetical protein [Streptomyces sp. NPDC001502]|uniref:hypothetical protein n=1 Tax=Streptomyces sp. NPDC001502 TaxID=3364578 RepID=UPI00368CBEF4
MTGKAQAWIGGTIAILAVGALAGYLIAVGLDDADKVASVIALFVALAGLAVSVAGLRRQARSSGGQAVEKSSVGGGIAQVDDTKGSVKIVRRGTQTGPPPAPPAGTTPPAAPAPSEGGQSVQGTAAAGSVDQVQETGGDVEIEE